MTVETGKHNRGAPVMLDAYEIELEGSINAAWFDWLEGWETSYLPNGNTHLSGWVRDQPALHGMLARIRDLNLKLVSLKIRT